MKYQIDGLLSKLPFNGWKTAIGWLMFVGSDYVPLPYGPAMKLAGEALVQVGLLHKAVK